MVSVPSAVTVAAGAFAPGHLGELTRYLPFELADDVLERTRTVQRRMRVLPSRVGIYFVLALALFPGIGYLRVWGKMTAALEDLELPRPSEKALRDLRRRLGPAIGGRGERSEVPLARKLVPLLRAGMLLLADRAYDAADLLEEVAATGAHVLVRGSASRKPAVEQA